MASFNKFSRAAPPPPIEVPVGGMDEEPGVTASTAGSPVFAYASSYSSDYSPLTPVSSTATTTRFSSSNSSIASSPLGYEPLDNSINFSKRTAPTLPDVQEHPLEFEEDARERGRMSFEQVSPRNANGHHRRNITEPPLSAPGWAAEFPRLRNTMTSSSQEHGAEGFQSDIEMRCEPSPKRRRSGESGLDSITSRFFSRLPSLSKHKDPKRRFGSRSETNSGVSSPVAGRSRSNSRARSSLSIFRRSEAADGGLDDTDGRRGSERIETITEDEGADEYGNDLRTFHPADENDPAAKPEELERVQTPLLPMLVDDQPPREPDVQSLEPPRVVDSGVGEWGYDSAGSIQHTPQLSAKTSTTFPKTSFSTAFSEENDLSAANATLSTLAVEEDEWSDKLGHANFIIRPTPYMPVYFTAESCTGLLSDWEKARTEFSKHLARTSKHFGHDSKLYRLTEEKWTSIDGMWRRCCNETRARAAVTGEVPPNSPSEPAPVVKIPALDEKFPQLSDFEVVGAMERVAPPERASTQVKRQPSKKSGFFKFIDGLNKRSRSASGPQ